MSELLTIRDRIRDFLRKYDEIAMPIIKFVAAIIMYISINSLFGYSPLCNKGIVVFLLSVITALVSSAVAVLLGGVVILIHSLSVSLEVAIVFLLLFIIMYCMYMRMFPDCSWVLALVPILYVIKMQYAIPLIVALFAGYSGIVPAAFGVVLYHFAKCTKDVNSLAASATDEEKFSPLNYMVDEVFKNEQMLLTIIVFAVVITATYFVYRLPITYSQYAAVGIGGVCNILFFMICSVALGVDNVPMGWLVVGSVIGVAVSYVAQICKGMVDYSRKETVQFEDDEYYYYVKAIPKFNVPAKNKNVRKMNDEMVAANVSANRNVANKNIPNRNPNNRNNVNR